FLSIISMKCHHTFDITTGNLVSFVRVPHFYGTAGWYHFFNQDAFFETSLWAKYVEGAPLNVDFSGRFQPIRTFWVGAGFNLNGIVHLETGVNVPGILFDNANLKIGYAFDYNISAFGLNFGTSHELSIAILFDTY
ncbi:MAG TPA: type IX secretion system membrane protein PorP/SprF, partial [Saprospiraceae bacterium]|nr:type IX secretion system membrane protein PorP/SprF [Saprospiraceae bacterium]HMP15142.1 type IX secretion system membrane protein PorP/SprF [Saprospiraceae bacterium]